MSHAWLIIAHNEFGILQRLVSLLDAPGCDFYIHIDKKVKVLPKLTVSQGNIYLLTERKDVHWGHISQIETELLLLRTAMRQGPYEHYHIISGTHLPLKTIEELQKFFEDHSNEEIMRIWPQDEGDADFKLRRYHLPLRDFKNPIKIVSSLCQLSWKVVLKFQKVFGLRHLVNERFIKTDNWLSLTESAVRYLVEREKQIIKKYRWSFCGDEYFVASELVASGNQFKIYDCQRLLYVEFKKESPRSLSLSEWDDLRKTDYFFARKFTEKSVV